MIKRNKSFLYLVSIILSVIDIIAVLSCGVALLFTLTGSLKPKNTFNATYSPLQTLLPLAFGATVVIGIILYPILSSWRQELRDEVEYDENGVSKKRGKFSQLSAEERKKIDLQNMMDQERILSANTLKTIKKPVYDDPDKELNTLIGLCDVKKEVAKMKARMEYELNEELKKGNKNVKKIHLTSNSHAIFTGNPGTGKTTVARILASYMYQYHFIEKPYYFEIDGNFFNGLTIGETSKKVNLLCRAAKGSCIYIDEAYALCSSRTQEAIASIVKQMEDEADNIVFIFAGYKKEMHEFLESNSGIQSRINYWFDFKDYTYEEIKEIFRAMANSHGFVPDSNLIIAVADKIEEKKKFPNFGNARDVRNLLDQIITNHAYNLTNNVISEDNRYRLVLRDFLIDI